MGIPNKIDYECLYDLNTIIPVKSSTRSDLWAIEFKFTIKTDLDDIAHKFSAVFIFSVKANQLGLYTFTIQTETTCKKICAATFCSYYEKKHKKLSVELSRAVNQYGTDNGFGFKKAS